MTIRAMLVDEFETFSVRLLVRRDRPFGTEWLCDDGSWVAVGEHEAAPDNAGIVLPHDAIEAIAEAFHPRAGHKVEVDRLAEALTVERQRVDRILDKAMAFERLQRGHG